LFFRSIIYDERLIPQKKNLEPMNYEAQQLETVENVTMDHIKKFFVNFMLSDELDKIADAHLAKADTSDVGAFHGQCIRLAQLHSEAVDYPKTGRPAIFPPELRAHKFPDFMEKTNKATYQSEKVLGRLYRSIEVDEFELYDNSNFDNRLHVEGYQNYLEDARILKRAYDADIKALMNQFGIATEFEVTSGYIVNTITKVDRKKSRDVTKYVMDAIIPIKRHYRKLFEGEYGKGTSAVPLEVRSRMEAKAYAWYYVTYHPSELSDDPSENMVSFPWIAYEFLCEIAIRNNGKVNTIQDYHKQSGPIGASKYHHQKAIQPEDNDVRLKQKMFIQNNNSNLDCTNYNQHLLDDFINNDDGMSKLRKNVSMRNNTRNPDYINYNQYSFDEYGYIR
jgi:RNA-dependent RNA polymerase